MSSEKLIQECREAKAELRKRVRLEKRPDCNLNFVDYFDGRWSEEIISSIKASGAHYLRLNEHWAMLPRDWACPCCLREKASIVRSDGETLFAEVQAHHDHFTSYVNDRAMAMLGPQWNRASTALTRACEQLRVALLAFSEVLICADCNGAEGRAKSRLRLDKYFSFSIEEIRAFINIRANEEHIVDLAAAKRVLSERKKLETLDARKDLADRSISLMAAGIYWRSSEQPDGPSEVFLKGRELLEDMGITYSGNFDPFTFSATTVGGGAPNRQAWRRAWALIRIGTPYVENARKFLADLKPPIPPEWCCPCCARRADRVVRFSRQRRLFIQLRYHAQNQICMDCHDVARCLALEVGWASEDIGFSDVIDAVEVRNGLVHKIRSDQKVDAVLDRVRQRSGALVHSPEDDDEPFSAIW